MRDWSVMALITPSRSNSSLHPSHRSLPVMRPGRLPDAHPARDKRPAAPALSGPDLTNEKSPEQSALGLRIRHWVRSDVSDR